jgi:membrane-bound lytic murein transglycosylase D
VFSGWPNAADLSGRFLKIINIVMKKITKKFLVVGFIFLLAWSAASSKRVGPFPVPDGMQLRVQFWVNVFTQYSVEQAVFFDADKPERIYSVVDFNQISPHAILSRDEKREILSKEKNRIVSLLKALSVREYREEELNGESLRIFRLFGRGPKPGTFIRAAGSVRIQRGMKETFKAGVERSGRYLEQMKAVFRDKGLPEELVYLVHVESSFNYHARSRSGAAGMWQFTRSTGRQFMNINPICDERKDPYISTDAASRLLMKNFLALGNWPLAITAYNHGLAGMKRAVRRTGSKDFSLIDQYYRSRSFGFASKNFYAEFLAAVQVARNPSAYFGKIVYDANEKFQIVKIPFSLNIDEAARVFRVKEIEVQQFNPALDRAILRGTRPIPKEYALRLPEKASVLGVVEKIRSQFEENQLAVQSDPENETERTEVVDAADTKENSFTALARMSPIISRKDNTQVEQDPSLSEVSETMIEMERSLWQKLPYPLKVDYLHVSDNNKIQILPEETLGHFAEWLEIPTWMLRKLNGLRYRQKIRVGEEIELVFKDVDPKVFEERRLAYHQQIQGAFFEKYSIESSKVHTVRRGETLWTMIKHHHGVPLWLLMQYNSGKDLNRLHPGDRLIVPVIRQTS